MQIVWNGCDGWIELALAEPEQGRLLMGGTFGGQQGLNKPFNVMPASWDEIPMDEEGEPNFEGFYFTETGNLYKDA